MRGKKSHSFVWVLNLLFYLLWIESLNGQVWWEETGKKYDYDLSRFHILVILGDDFDYQEAMVIKNYWENWGAKVDIAGVDSQLTGHLWKKTRKGWDRSEIRRIKTDLLLPQVKLSGYQVLFFPGGNSPANLLKNDSMQVVQMIQQGARRGLILAGICHGTRVLASAGVIQGRQVTGHRDVVKGIERAGGVYVNEVCVVDGNIITGNWPYFETMAVKVAEKLLYPRGGGPSEKSPFVTNPILRTIKDRRNVWRFQDRELDSTLVEQILRAATWAPSPDNVQPWKFVVVRHEKTKERIVDALVNRLRVSYEKQGFPLARIRTYWASVFSAPVIIFAFYDTSDINLNEEWEEMGMLPHVQSVSLACQNILLAAAALNLGSHWIWEPFIIADKIKTLLKVPDRVRLIAVIAIGYPAHKPLPLVRKNLKYVRTFEKWE